MMYEPGCMDAPYIPLGPKGYVGINVNEIRTSENAGIIVPSGENMIIKKNWRNLDDGDDGIGASTVDWSGCTVEMKRLLIEEFRMGYIVNGWRPVSPSEITNDKHVVIQGGKAKLTSAEWFTFEKCLIAYLITIFPMFVLSSYLIDSSWSDALDRTIIGAGLMNLFVSWITLCIWCVGIEMPWRLRRQQRIYDEGKTKQNLNDFIEECRK